jgi:hypothetical protein
MAYQDPAKHQEGEHEDPQKQHDPSKAHEDDPSKRHQTPGGGPGGGSGPPDPGRQSGGGHV